MLAFAFGIGAVIVALGYGARSVLQKRQALMRRIATSAKPVLGTVFLFVGVAILMRLHYMAEAWLLDILPIWLQDLSVAL